MRRADAFLLAAETALALLEREEVGHAWDQPSALSEFRVSGLSGHLASQLFNARRLVEDAPEPPDSRAAEPIPLIQHYLDASWLGDIDTDANVAIRDGGERLAESGQQPLVDESRAALDRLRALLADAGERRPVYIPWTGWSLTLESFLTTRMLELLVHSDDLAVSVGVETPEFPAEVVEPVVDLLCRISLRRHGQAAVVRALSRRERAPETIAAI